MIKTVLGAAAAFVLGAAALSGTAEAQCVWTGFTWSCPVAPTYYYYPQTTYVTPYYYYPYTYDATDNASKPSWLPSYPGPKPSGGSGH